MAAEVLHRTAWRPQRERLALSPAWRQQFRGASADLRRRLAQQAPPSVSGRSRQRARQRGRLQRRGAHLLSAWTPCFADFCRRPDPRRFSRFLTNAPPRHVAKPPPTLFCGAPPHPLRNAVPLPFSSALSFLPPPPRGVDPAPPRSVFPPLPLLPARAVACECPTTPWTIPPSPESVCATAQSAPTPMRAVSPPGYASPALLVPGPRVSDPRTYQPFRARSRGNAPSFLPCEWQRPGPTSLEHLYAPRPASSL
mmetsp:Transcript_99653/g.281260  ORF Transcript_99653/g.281260 Transcript_99653/m.281260 type:complete len:253 (+) Transcript_99653:22-780(+)